MSRCSHSSNCAPLAKVQLVRAPSSLEERVTVIDTASSQCDVAQWEAGGDTAAWPANLALRPDGAYLIVVGKVARRRRRAHPAA
jgi:hypothetical protein